MSNTASRSRHVDPGALVWGSVVLGALAVAAGAIVSGTTRFRETGDSFPGWFTAVAFPTGHFVVTMLSAIAIGSLVYITICARPDSHRMIGIETFRAHRIVQRTALGWLAGAIVMIVITAADRSGVSTSALLSTSAIMQIVEASEQAVAWIVSACCALVIAIVVRITLSWTAHALLVIPALIAAVALPVAGNAGQGPNHDYTTTAMIVFAAAVAVITGLRVAAATTIGRDTPEQDRMQTGRRLAWTLVILDAVTIVYGLILIGFLVPIGQLATSAYGRWALIAALAALVGSVVDVRILTLLRRSSVIAPRTVMLFGAGVVAATALQAALAGMATRTAPALLEHEFTAWDVFLGYELPDGPSAARLAFLWRPDLFLGVGAIVLAVLYVIGVQRLRRRGIEWGWTRTLSWVLGCLSLLVVTSSGVRTYGMAMFSVHMAEHMALNMFIPVLLVLGAPVTLALRALPTARGGLPRPREWIVWLVHSRFTRILTNPIVALLIFVISLYGVYFTSLFDTLARYHWGHDLMSVHFLITGYLFYWIIIGIDPGPKRLPFLGRLGLLFAVMPFHAFFGIATMTMDSLIGGTFYTYLGLPWLDDLYRDQFVGGAIAWGASEVPALLVVIALVHQWATQDRRLAKRRDRHADTYDDDELTAYNRMLSELSRDR
ncbi:cytochrome c oxidase assembly protein [Gordonia aquimaris]|uniref:Cytochrome c oxidase assembly protein n=1 Tax=Gordonia aquimaris TaxID=2984863 RepID=A0A9X3D6B2_9ACTN|nr:cytochrome c oxidase assembly protein [Gordonia aquimaris]MCX2964561.1 cytochrome c oxidase assembly protein [Gordonia aquimaris]